ncbi:MAG: CPBP family intramembrane metalloprotease [Bacteroidales bacterium]|nr:CPBP family intramembrane metalloprotease [Bacteroidales bacterium]MCF8403772.1 CPBP family intramembrane metalloprotease [Bacteroidales bacterium]
MKLSNFFPYIQHKPFYLKVLILLLLIASFLVVTMVFGLIAAIPFYGIEVLTRFSELGNLNDPETISLLKYFQVVNQLGVFVLPSLVFAFLYNGKAGSYLKLNSIFNPGLFILSLLVIVASIPAINYLVELNEMMKLPSFLSGIENWMRESEEQTKELTDAFLASKSVQGYMVNMLIIAVLAGIGEELLFRGVVLRLILEGSKNIHIAIFVSAFLFSALHLQFYGFLPRMMIGVIFGYVYYWSANLWIPIILHIVFNGISVTAAYLYEIGKISTDLDSFGTAEDAYIILLSFVISVGLLFLLYRRRLSYT